MLTTRLTPLDGQEAPEWNLPLRLASLLFCAAKIASQLLESLLRLSMVKDPPCFALPL